MRPGAYSLSAAAACAILALLLPPTPFTAAALAQTPSELLNACVGNVSLPAGAAVDACTALINSETTKVVRARHYTLRGDAYVRQGDLQAALRDFDEAIRLNRSLESLRHRQSVRLKLKMYKEAFADADAAQLLDKGSPSSLNASCWVRAVAGLELKAGLSACDRALKMRPNNPAFLDSRGLMRLRLGDYEGARTDYTAALRWWPELASSRYGLGVALMRLGRTAEGQQEIAAAVKMSESIAADFESFGIKP